MPGEPPTAAHSRNAGSSFLKKQTYDTCTQLCGAVDQSSRQSLGLSSCTVFPAPLYHEGNSTQMTSIMKRRLLLFFSYLFGKYIHMIRAVVRAVKRSLGQGQDRRICSLWLRRIREVHRWRIYSLRIAENCDQRPRRFKITFFSRTGLTLRRSRMGPSGIQCL